MIDFPGSSRGIISSDQDFYQTILGWLVVEEGSREDFLSRNDINQISEVEAVSAFIQPSLLNIKSLMFVETIFHYRD